MPYRIELPVDVPRIQEVLDALEAEIDAREQATVELALAHEELGEDFKAYLKRLTESGVCN